MGTRFPPPPPPGLRQLPLAHAGTKWIEWDRPSRGLLYSFDCSARSPASWSWWGAQHWCHHRDSVFRDRHGV